MNTPRAVCAALALLCTAPAHAWGARAHRNVTTAAFTLLRERDHGQGLPDWLARADTPDSAARLLDAGANAVVQPLLESGLELTYQALHGYGVPANEIRQAQARRRREG